MAGRALRPAPGKDYAVLLDHTKNHLIHGLPTRKRIWSLEGVEQEPEELEDRGDGLGLIKKEIVEDIIELVEVEELGGIWGEWWWTLLSVQLTKKYREGWLYYQVVDACPPVDVWLELARQLGRSPTWAMARFNEQEAANQTKATPPPLPSYVKKM